MPPPHRDTAKAVKRSIAKVEKIEDRTNTDFFPTPYSQLPMDNTDKVTNHLPGPGSTPQEPLAFVARISDSERSASESEGRAVVNAVLDTSPEIRYRASFITFLLFFSY